VPSGVYVRTPCAPDCTCKKHAPRERSAAYRANISAAAKARGFTHRSGCGCGWCLQKAKKNVSSRSAIHARLARDKGAADHCDKCGTPDSPIYDWAFTGAGHLDGEGGFSMDMADYIQLCRGCHRKFDTGNLSWP